MSKLSLTDCIKAQSIDYSFDGSMPEEFKKNITVVLQGDGLYEVRKTPFALLCSKKADFKVPGYNEPEMKQWFKLLLPKIPEKLYHQIEAFFWHYCNREELKGQEEEVYVQVFWDVDKKEYFLYVPEQQVSGTSVDYKRDVELEAKHWLVCEIHSHNSMGSFFSATDDKDETEDRFYCVIGNLDKAEPKLTSSFVCGGVRVKIENTDLWDLSERPLGFPEEWKKRVTKKPSVVVTAKGKGTKYVDRSRGLSKVPQQDDVEESFYGMSPEDWERYMGHGPDDKLSDMTDLEEAGNQLLDGLMKADTEPAEIHQLASDFFMTMDESEIEEFFTTAANLGMADKFLYVVGGLTLDEEE